MVSPTQVVRNRHRYILTALSGSSEGMRTLGSALRIDRHALALFTDIGTYVGERVMVFTLDRDLETAFQ